MKTRNNKIPCDLNVIEYFKICFILNFFDKLLLNNIFSFPCPDYKLNELYVKL